jgi:two-component sensor histidine kinase
LQLVHSALAIQLKTLDDKAARDQVSEAAGRVLAIAAVHRRLYQGGSSMGAGARQYIQGLLDDLKLLLPSSAGSQSLGIDMENVPLPADDLAHLGLITVELVTNAMKHGRGRVQVDVKREAHQLLVSVSDEGPGYPADFDAATNSGLGLKIVSWLAGQPQNAAIAVDRSVPFSRILVRMALLPVKPLFGVRASDTDLVS